MKKAVVVGATSGIGRGLAKILVENGYIAGITGRRIALLSELKNKNPESYYIKACDITDTENITLHLEELITVLGGMDLLIICSGTGELNENLDFKLEIPTIATNVNGFTAVVDWAFNFFQKQNSGQLVTISSIGGLRGSRQAPAYNASKAYQINYMEGLRQKATRLKSDITVTDIRPGLVDTDMAKGEGLFWLAPVDKACQQIFRAIKNKRKVAYITKRWGLIALLFKVLPRAIYERM